MRKRGLSAALAILLAALVILPGAAEAQEYVLEQAVILSRHNIRTPLYRPGSVTERITSRAWRTWEEAPGELTGRGGASETLMGAWFRRWLAEEGLFPETVREPGNAVRVYANGRQRTIATARFFLSGLFPAARADVEVHAALEATDPVFSSALTFVSPAYQAAVEDSLRSLCGAADTAHLAAGLADAFALLEEIVGLEDSPAFAAGEAGHFRTDDTRLTLRAGRAPALRGSLRLAQEVSDALILQLYEERDDAKAALGTPLTAEQWETVASVKDFYIRLLYGTHLLAVNAAHPLLKELAGELRNEERSLAFLCGHDTNLAGVLSSLRVLPFDTPGTVEGQTPIGGRIVFASYRSPDGGRWMRLSLVYPGTQQLRELSVLTDENPPMSVTLELEGLTAAAGGYYRREDVLKRFDEAIAAYDLLTTEYAAPEDDAA